MRLEINAFSSFHFYFSSFEYRMAELIIGLALGVMYHTIHQNEDSKDGQHQTGGQKRKRKDSKSASYAKRKRRSEPEQKPCACTGCTKCKMGTDNQCARMRYGRLRNCDPCYRERLHNKKQKVKELKEWVNTTMEDLDEDFDKDLLHSVGDWMPVKRGGDPTQPVQTQITDVLQPEGGDTTNLITQFLNPYAESQLQGHNIMPDERNAECTELLEAMDKKEWDKVKYLILGKGCITKGTRSSILEKHPLLRAYHIAKYASVRERGSDKIRKEPYPPPLRDALHNKYFGSLEAADAEFLIRLEFLSENSVWMKEMVLSSSFEPGVLHRKYVQWLQDQDNELDYDEKSVMGGFTQDQLEWIILINFIIDELDAM